MPESDSSSVVPAQLSFLAIYNPKLGTTDETIKEQIVFYTARSSLRRKDGSETDKDKESGDDWNERLRQVGLAQGMVTFAKYEPLLCDRSGTKNYSGISRKARPSITWRRTSRRSYCMS